MKKLVCLLLVTIVSVAPGNQKDSDPDLIDPAEIIDWNTNGEELSMCLADGSECYGYRKTDEYGDKRCYIACKEVISWEVNDGELTVYTVNGDSYKFD